MRKKLLASLLAVVMVIGMLPATAVAANFSDTNGHWGQSAINRWADVGILSGKGDGNFDPNGTMTRAEFAQMLSNMMGYTNKAANVFTDVPSGAWYEDAMLKLMAAGVIQGNGDGTANPNGPITREQAAVMLCRAFDIQPSRSATLNYADSASISSWARDAMAALAERGMMNGVGDNTAAPLANINRASVATLADNMIAEYVTESKTITGKVDGIILVAGGVSVNLDNATVSQPVIVAPKASGVNVNLTGSTSAENVVVEANGAKVNVGAEASASSVVSSAPNADITVSGKVDSVEVADANNSVSVSGTVGTVTAEAPNTNVTVSGTVSNVEIADTASRSSVNVTASGKVDSVATDASNVSVSGNGTVGSVTATGGSVDVTTKGTEVSNQGANNVTSSGKPVESGSTGTSSGTASSGSSSGDDSSGSTPSTPSSPSGPSTPVTYTVTFNLNYVGAADPTIKSVEKNSKVVPPSDPTREDYTFDGWYTLASGGTLYDFDKPVTESFDLYAHWTEIIADESLSVTIDGTPRVGQELTANVKPSSDAASTYKWQRGSAADSDFSDITDATSSTYTVANDDKELYIRVIVTGTSDYGGKTATSPAVKIAGSNGKISLTDVSITGSLKVGETLTAEVTPSSAADSVTYQWMAGIDEIANATEKTYTLTTAEIGKTITVTVTAADAGDYVGTVSSEPTSKVPQISLSSAQVTISTDETPYNGSPPQPTITVTYGTQSLIQDTDYTVSYAPSDQDITANSGDLPVYADTYSVTIHGTGFYTDTIDKDATGKPLTFTISKVDPSPDMFDFTKPSVLDYNRQEKKANVTLKSSYSDPGGSYQVIYYDRPDSPLGKTPVDVGTYTVKVKVDGGRNLNSKEISSDEWSFIIIPAIISNLSYSITKNDGTPGSTSLLEMGDTITVTFAVNPDVEPSEEEVIYEWLANGVNIKDDTDTGSETGISYTVTGNVNGVISVRVSIPSNSNFAFDPTVTSNTLSIGEVQKSS